ncbi:FCD domain-containing protein [Mangrovicella endophytica]|uniref:FCD domain-containing protein n=1 Tax=Mangrovicella endophytica TaxID=2066697 RepID=UPI000C9EC0D2|nr:FCD domain-containing protein [Mangrovicella endophytica]
MSDSLNPPQHLAAIDFLRTRSLANVVQAEIERMIIDGELKPNERVNENGLSQRLGVSRGPIREACSALAAMGLIEIIPNRGFFIRALTNDEAQDLSEARASVFGCICMMLAERITDVQLTELRALTARMDEIVALGDVHVYYPVNLEFHRQIAVMAGNKRLELLYQSFVRELHIQRYRALASNDVLHISNEEHRAIVDALEARDPVRALLAGRGHIMNGIVRTRKAGQPGADGAPAEAAASAKAATRRGRTKGPSTGS